MRRLQYIDGEYWFYARCRQCGQNHYIKEENKRDYTCDVCIRDNTYDLIYGG